MAEGYFYTLSAVAQSFAAIVALNAVFVIYKLQLLRNQRNELILTLRQLLVQKEDPTGLIGPRDRASDRVVRMTENQVLEECRDIVNKKGIFSDRFKEQLDLFDKNGQFSKNITKWFRRTLLFNSITILVSLALLPWKNLFPNFLQCILVVIVFLLVIFALLLTIHAILFTIELPGLMIIDRIFGKKNKS